MSTPAPAATPTIDPLAVARAARAAQELGLTRDGYLPLGEQSWREFWDSPSADHLREDFTAALLASGLVTPRPTT